ncbi:hypothetical protein [Rubrolithibacter danxiaensis]|uniref:hypothetical protein n=1 Tax=Rubrolithibacter danxiaensis TaxID=3390805 RepID=UPI003BF80053
MDPKNKFYPGFNDENLDRDKVLKDELGAEIDKDDLSFNEEENSYELDVESKDGDYFHPDPYDTAAKNGEDYNSTYDEANAAALDEYSKDASLETDLDDLGMHIDDGSIVEVDPIDESLAQTPEDERDDLDEEGYPKNDADQPMK